MNAYGHARATYDFDVASEDRRRGDSSKASGRGVPCPERRSGVFQPAACRSRSPDVPPFRLD